MGACINVAANAVPGFSIVEFRGAVDEFIPEYAGASEGAQQFLDTAFLHLCPVASLHHDIEGQVGIPVIRLVSVGHQMLGVLVDSLVHLGFNIDVRMEIVENSGCRSRLQNLSVEILMLLDFMGIHPG